MEPISTEKLQETYKEMEKFNTEIYFTARAIGGKRVTEKMAISLRAIICYRKIGLQFCTTDMIIALTEETPGNAVSKLHNLGDRKILTLVRRGGYEQLYYCLSPQFLEMLPSHVQEHIGVPVTEKKRILEETKDE